jgi:sulfide dehydrogenase [flavocytochrome c] flavoprotein subunit
MDRRSFLATAGLGLGGGILTACGGGADLADVDSAQMPVPNQMASLPVKSRVIVVGGGMGGATVAKYLRLWGDAISVTLIERSTSYQSNIMSSLVLTGQRSMSSLTYSYDILKSKYGINMVFGDVKSIDPVSMKVTMVGGSILSADRIVIAPGIDFDPVAGLGTSDRMPHAWKAGPQTTLLAKQLSAMPLGGRVILTIPKTPYRCPPGPYERACLIADWLRLKKPGSKLLVLDANPDIVVEKDNFMNAFLGIHGNVVEYLPNTEVTQVDPATLTLTTTAGSLRGDVVNLIPRQRAGALISTLGLNNATENRFAGVNNLTYASTVPGFEKVHIIGDASATLQPKAGHIANQEAKVCADAISRLLSGKAPDQAPVTNSACFSTITMTEASWLSAGYQYDPTSAAMKLVPASFGASTGWSSNNFDQMNNWFKSLMLDSFA